MKTLFFKNGMPVAAAVLAIIGAFATTSMQNSSGAFASVVGYTLDSVGECAIATVCCDVVSTQICRLSYPNGPRAYGKNAEGYCTHTLWRCPGE